MCKKECAMDYVHLQSEQVNVRSIYMRFSDSSCAIFCEKRFCGLGWTCFDSMTDHTIRLYDTINVIRNPLQVERSHLPGAPTRVLSELQVTLPRILVTRDRLCESIKTCLYGRHRTWATYYQHILVHNRTMCQFQSPKLGKWIFCTCDLGDIPFNSFFRTISQTFWKINTFATVICKYFNPPWKL